MRALITGATGFIGSYVAHSLLARGWAVAAIVRGGADPWRIASLLPQLHVIGGDLAAGTLDVRAIAAFAPTLTIHLAWDGVSGRVRDDPRQVDNVAAGVRLVEAVRAAGCRRFIGLGSQAEYGPSRGPLDEDSATTPLTMYGVAKLATCRLTRRLCELHGI